MFLRRDRGYVIYLHIIENYILTEVKLLMNMDLNEKAGLRSKHIKYYWSCFSPTPHYYTLCYDALLRSLVNDMKIYFD